MITIKNKDEVTWPPPIATGDFFLVDNRLYLLSQVKAKQVALVSVGEDSNRYQDPVHVLDTKNLSIDEVLEVFAGSTGTIWKVAVEATITPVSKYSLFDFKKQ
jgi:hypothetical protein